MARFKWHADYFDGRATAECVRRTIIQADNACEAEKIAQARLGLCKRVEVRRVATAAPVRIVYAHEAPSSRLTAATEVISFKGNILIAPVAG
jgi:hypothetical protein